MQENRPNNQENDSEQAYAQKESSSWLKVLGIIFGLFAVLVLLIIVLYSVQGQFMGDSSAARDQTRKEDISVVQDALDTLYQVSGQYPSELPDVSRVGTSSSVGEALTDPQTNEPYAYAAINDGQAYCIGVCLVGDSRPSDHSSMCAQKLGRSCEGGMLYAVKGESEQAPSREPEDTQSEDTEGDDPKADDAEDSATTSQRKQTNLKETTGQVTTVSSKGVGLNEIYIREKSDSELIGVDEISELSLGDMVSVTYTYEGDYPYIEILRLESGGDTDTQNGDQDTQQTSEQQEVALSLVSRRDAEATEAGFKTFWSEVEQADNYRLTIFRQDINGSATTEKVTQETVHSKMNYNAGESQGYCYYFRVTVDALDNGEIIGTETKDICVMADEENEPGTHPREAS